VAPVNETDMVLLPEGLKALKKVAKEVGLDLRGAYLNLDGGFDSAHNRKCIFNAGIIPNIKERTGCKFSRVSKLRAVTMVQDNRAYESGAVRKMLRLRG